MGDSSSDIPALWDDETDDRLNYTHTIADVSIEIRGISSGDTQVEEREEFDRGGNTKWDVIVSHAERELRHGERKSTESEAEELAVEFMNEFEETYEGDAERAYIETLESR